MFWMSNLNVALRPACEADLWIFEEQAVDPEVGGIFNWSGFRNVAATKRRLMEDGLIGNDDGCLVVWTDDEPVGTVVWKKAYYGTPSWFCWNIGISVLPNHRHKGVGTKSQAALVRYLFDTSPVQRIEAYTDVANVAEQRALGKIGFIREGVLRSTQFRQGSWRDLYLYSMMREDFSASRHSVPSEQTRSRREPIAPRVDD